MFVASTFTVRFCGVRFVECDFGPFVISGGGGVGFLVEFFLVNGGWRTLTVTLHVTEWLMTNDSVSFSFCPF